MATSIITKQVCIKKKIVSGTSDANGRLSLGLNNGNAVISIFNNRNLMTILMLNVNTFQWEAVLVDRKSDGSLIVMPNVSCTIDISYL